MLNKLTNKWILLGALLLGACSPTIVYVQPTDRSIDRPAVVATSTAVPVPAATAEDAASQPETIRSHEQARDLVVAYLAARFGLGVPGTWQVQDQTPSGLVGASTFRFIGEAWTVVTSAPVVAPADVIYQVSVDHVASGLHWEGTVNASGQISEQALIPPVSVRTPEQARDLAVAYVAQARGLAQPAAWTTQPDELNNKGEMTKTYTGGPWVVQVVYSPGAPFVNAYDVTLDHLSAVLRWHGNIDAQGEIAGTFVNAELSGNPSSQTSGEQVDGWVGNVVGNPGGSQWDDYFQMLDQNGSRYGIDGADDEIRSQLASYRDSTVLIRVWGTFIRDVPDAYGTQIMVTRIEIYKP
jgi:hypothetical protein